MGGGAGDEVPAGGPGAGLDGMRAFFTKHACNGVCHAHAAVALCFENKLENKTQNAGMIEHMNDFENVAILERPANANGIYEFRSNSDAHFFPEE